MNNRQEPVIQKQNMLPNDMWLTIFSYLDLSDLLTVATVCKLFNKVSADKRLWLRFFNEAPTDSQKNDAKNAIHTQFKNEKMIFTKPALAILNAERLKIFQPSITNALHEIDFKSTPTYFPNCTNMFVNSRSALIQRADINNQIGLHTAAILLKTPQIVFAFNEDDLKKLEPMIDKDKHLLVLATEEGSPIPATKDNVINMVIKKGDDINSFYGRLLEKLKKFKPAPKLASLPNPVLTPEKSKCRVM